LTDFGLKFVFGHVFLREHLAVKPPSSRPQAMNLV
jgi:hypothetical protein